MKNQTLLQKLAFSADLAELAIQINILSKNRISRENAEDIEEALSHLPTKNLEVILNLINNKIVKHFCLMLIKNKRYDKVNLNS